MKQKMMGTALAAAAAVTSLYAGTTVYGATGVDLSVFQDETLRNVVADQFDTDGNGVLSAKEIKAAEYLSTYVEDGEVTDLTGLDKLTSLISVDIAQFAGTTAETDSQLEFLKIRVCGSSITVDAPNVLYLDVESAEKGKAYDYYTCSSVDVSACENADSIFIAAAGMTTYTLPENLAHLTGLTIQNSALEEIRLPDMPALENLSLNENEKLKTVELGAAKKLTDLSVQSSKNLTTLDLSNISTITFLSVWETSISSLDISSLKNLTWLSCCNNNLTSLDVSSNTALKNMLCAKNKLSSLDISKNTELDSLNCSDNKIGALEIPNSLTYLECQNNKLKSLIFAKQSAIKELHCYGNPLNKLCVKTNKNIVKKATVKPKFSSVKVLKKSYTLKIKLKNQNKNAIYYVQANPTLPAGVYDVDSAIERMSGKAPSCELYISGYPYTLTVEGGIRYKGANVYASASTYNKKLMIQ